MYTTCKKSSIFWPVLPKGGTSLRRNVRTLKGLILLGMGISLVLASVGMVSAVPFDSTSDVSITDHAGETWFGVSVATAGDLNGDGYADLVVGASGAKKAFVYYGGPSFDRISDVNITDHTGELNFGYSLATAGDLNNDGYADLVVGASGAKKAFVYYGGPSFDRISDVNITDHTGESAFGCSLASTGDLNNDGYTDLVVGTEGDNKVFVYYGGPSFDGVSDVNITDHLGETSFGFSLAMAGDLNGDGYADLVVGAYNVRKAFVYYGGPSFDGVSDVSITDHIGESFGWSLATAGDLNDDGYADLVVGTYHAKAFVYYGGPAFDGTSDLSITDHTGEDGFGCSLVTAGDLNNDGYADLVVGSAYANKAFVYYGGPSFDGASDVSIMDHMGSSGFGYSLATAGDLNNDGYADLVVGTYPGANKAFVYHGVNYPVNYLPQPTIVTVQGKLTNSMTGSSIQRGSMRVTIRDALGNQAWQSSFNDCIADGVFNIPLGAVQELRLIPGNRYQLTVEIDADAAAFSTTDVTFGDNAPSGDVITFTG
jgi:hypothetical protein